MRVAIVGCGYAGAVALDQLIASCPASTEFIVLEQNSSRGEGKAYQNDSDQCRLNRPAELMFFRQQGDFQRTWGLQPTEFAPRHLFGKFLRSEVDSIFQRHAPRVKYLNGSVTRIQRAGAGYRIFVGSGAAILADFVVLAVGSEARSLPYDLDGKAGYIHQPYPVQASLRYAGRRIGIVGCKHSAVDVALTILEGDPSRLVLLTSRRSGLPRPTDAYQRLPLRTISREGLTREFVQNSGSLRSAVRIVNAELRAWGIQQSLVRLMSSDTHRTGSADASLIYGIISSMNGELAEIWNLMPEAERLVFRSRWELLWKDFRVPLPKPSVEAIQSYVNAGNLTKLCGLVGIEKTRSGFAMAFSGGRIHEVDTIVNASGPSVEVVDGLPRALLEDGVATVDPMGGIQVDFATGLATVNGLGHRLYVLGQLRCGSYFGVGSIDAIQDQVVRMKTHLLASLATREQPHIEQQTLPLAVA